MNKELFEVLEALCDMWSQYCSGSHSHMFMTAGENAEEVLDKYQLLYPTGNGIECKVDYGKLEEYRN
mgnify:FL=1